MNLRDRDELELSAILNDALAAKQDAENVISDVQQEREYRKDMKMRCAECDCQHGGVDCNWIKTPTHSKETGND